MKKSVFITSAILGIIVGLLIGVLASSINPGASGNPGHSIESIGPPTGCVAGQFLKYNAGPFINWVCEDVAGGSSYWKSGAVGEIYYTSGTLAVRVGIGTSTPNSMLSVGGNGDSNYKTSIINSASGNNVYLGGSGSYAGKFEGDVRFNKDIYVLDGNSAVKKGFTICKSNMQFVNGIYVGAC